VYDVVSCLCAQFWIKTMLLTAAVYPLSCFGIGFVLNTIAIFQHSLAAVPFGTMVVRMFSHCDAKPSAGCHFVMMSLHQADFRCIQLLLLPWMCMAPWRADWPSVLGSTARFLSCYVCLSHQQHYHRR
jgi:Endomembrane protein 70